MKSPTYEWFKAFDATATAGKAAEEAFARQYEVTLRLLAHDYVPLDVEPTTGCIDVMIPLKQALAFPGCIIRALHYVGSEAADMESWAAVPVSLNTSAGVELSTVVVTRADKLRLIEHLTALKLIR